MKGRPRWCTLWLLPAVLSLSCGLVGGCGKCTDLSRDPKYLGTMQIGRAYRLSQDVFIYEWEEAFGCGTPKRWLMPERAKPLGSEPLPSIEEFRRTGWRDVVGIMPAGTELSLTKIVFQDAVTWAEVYYVFTIRSGGLAGQKVCGNHLMVIPQEAEPDPAKRYPYSGGYLSVPAVPNERVIRAVD